MDALATAADLEARLGRPLNVDEAARAAAVLRDVSASVRNYTGQQFNQATTTARLRVRDGLLRLPQRPVLAVLAMADTQGREVQFEWLGGDVVELTGTAVLADGWSFEPRRAPLAAVDVTYRHGYSPVPDDVVGVACGVALRALGTQPTLGGITQESVAGYSYSLGPAGASGGFGLLNDERAVLEGYRRPAGRTEVAR